MASKAAWESLDDLLLGHNFVGHPLIVFPPDAGEKISARSAEEAVAQMKLSPLGNILVIQEGILSYPAGATLAAALKDEYAPKTIILGLFFYGTGAAASREGMDTLLNALEDHPNFVTCNDELKAAFPRVEKICKDNRKAVDSLLLLASIGHFPEDMLQQLSECLPAFGLALHEFSASGRGQSYTTERLGMIAHNVRHALKIEASRPVKRYAPGGGPYDLAV
jgi:hypothetical protein